MTISADRMTPGRDHRGPRPVARYDRVRVMAIARREMGRYLAMPMHTLIGPALTAFLFFTVFAVAYGELLVGAVTKAAFVAPGVILLGAMQAAFHNSAASLVSAKVHGSLADIMMSPLATAEWLAGHVIAAVLRVWIIGALALLAIGPFVDGLLFAPVATVAWLAAAAAVFGLFGLIAGIVTDHFDRMNDWIAFAVMPACFLSGAFFSIDILPGALQAVLLINPAAHLVDGLRGALIGVTTVPGLWSAAYVALLILAEAAIAFHLLATGHRLRT